MNYLKIEHEDVCNGTGLRCTIWLTSCSHKCSGCFNKESWNPDGGRRFDESTEQELFNELSKDYISGLTLTGGDPLHENNLDEVLCLIGKARELFPSKTIWLWTGYTWEFIWKNNNEFLDNASKEHENQVKRQDIISLCDVVIDGEYMEEKRDISLKWRGSSNQRVIDVKKSLKTGDVVLWDI